MTPEIAAPFRSIDTACIARPVCVRVTNSHNPIRITQLATAAVTMLNVTETLPICTTPGTIGSRILDESPNTSTTAAWKTTARISVEISTAT